MKKKLKKIGETYFAYDNLYNSSGNKEEAKKKKLVLNELIKGFLVYVYENKVNDTFLMYKDKKS
jgi:hypothetical protein